MCSRIAEILGVWEVGLPNSHIQERRESLEEACLLNGLTSERFSWKRLPRYNAIKQRLISNVPHAMLCLLSHLHCTLNVTQCRVQH